MVSAARHTYITHKIVLHMGELSRNFLHYDINEDSIWNVGKHISTSTSTKGRILGHWIGGDYVKCICGYWWARSHEGTLPIWLNKLYYTSHPSWFFETKKPYVIILFVNIMTLFQAWAIALTKGDFGRDGVKRLTRQFKSCFTWFQWIRHGWYRLIIVVHIMIVAKPCL
jgi:hypothetical protein